MEAECDYSDKAAVDQQPDRAQRFAWDTSWPAMDTNHSSGMS